MSRPANALESEQSRIQNTLKRNKMALATPDSEETRMMSS